jgi:hypothetical protein
VVWFADGWESVRFNLDDLISRRLSPNTLTRERFVLAGRDAGLVAASHSRKIVVRNKIANRTKMPTTVDAGTMPGEVYAVIEPVRRTSSDNAPIVRRSGQPVPSANCGSILEGGLTVYQSGLVLSAYWPAGCLVLRQGPQWLNRFQWLQR